MSYKELIEYLNECCINNVPVCMSSVLNTIKQNDKIRIDFVTISKKGSSYTFSYNSKIEYTLYPVYRIDISEKNSYNSSSIIFNFNEDTDKINKVLFVSLDQSSLLGTSCKDIKNYTC